MPYKVDFTNAADGFELVPAGRYEVEVESAEIEGPGPSGSMYLAVRFRIVNDDEFEGRLLFQNFSFSEKALFRIKPFLKAVGFDEDDLGGELELDETELVGISLEVLVRQQKNKESGEMVNNVSRFYALGGDGEDDEAEEEPTPKSKRK